jgi:hypothetical protein
MSPKFPVGTVNDILRCGRAERRRGGEVIDHLRDDARPVDRIDARKPHPVAKAWWLNRPFTSAWQSSKVPSTASACTLLSSGGRHHPPLHVGDAAVREQHKQIGPLAAAERLDRGAAGVARGRDHDGGALRRAPPARDPSAAPADCMATSLNASVGPWNSSSRKVLAPNCASGTTAGCRKVP